MIPKNATIAQILEIVLKAAELQRATAQHQAARNPGARAVAMDAIRKAKA